MFLVYFSLCFFLATRDPMNNSKYILDEYVMKAGHSKSDS